MTHFFAKAQASSSVLESNEEDEFLETISGEDRLYDTNNEVSDNGSEDWCAKGTRQCQSGSL